MAKITPESIANLKALFQDNEKALGSNFSQLIDFFNDNKVTDNGDGTFTVGAITVDASKLYNLINNSSPNILPLDNEFTGKNTFDIAPINKANGKPYITEDSVPQVDLSNYAPQQQLATKADDSKVVHLDDLLGGRNYLTNTSNPTTSNPIQFFGEVASPVGNVNYSNGGVTLTTATSGETYYRFNGANRRMPLQAGQTYTLSYTMSGTTGLYLDTRIICAKDTIPTWYDLLNSYHACTTKPMNYKDTFTVPDTALSLIVSVQVYADTNKNSDNTGTNSVTFSNAMLEKGEVQHDWVPALEDTTDTMASKSDVTTAISTATANMVDSSKPTNFTAGLQSGGGNVATAADLKSVEDASWRELDLSGTSGLYKGKINIKIDDANKTIYLQGAMYFPGGTNASQGTKLLDLSNVVNRITSAHGYLFFINGNNEHATMTGDGGSSDYTASTLGFSNSSITVNSNVQFYFGPANYILPFPDAGKSNIYVTYDKLV